MKQGHEDINKTLIHIPLNKWMRGEWEKWTLCFKCWRTGEAVIEKKFNLHEQVLQDRKVNHSNMNTENGEHFAP